MKYQSTRNNKISVDSALAIKRGISPEGGLYVPETIPSVSLDDIKRLSGMKYTQRAAEVLGMFLTDFTKEELNDCALAAYAKEKFESVVYHLRYRIIPHTRLKYAVKETA